MSIRFTQVTWYSQILAVVIGMGIFGCGFYLGVYSQGVTLSLPVLSTMTVSPVTPVEFYPLDGMIPLHLDKGVVTSQEQLDALYEAIEPNPLLPKPEVDFKNFFILFQKVASSGCSAPTTITLWQKKRLLVLDVRVHQKGACQVWRIGSHAILVSRDYLELPVEFKLTMYQSGSL